MRFAYLFMVHKWTKTLEQAIALVDDPRNDIFLHVDQKARDFPLEKLRSLPLKSALYLTSRRVRVYWGDYSQIQAELLLLKEAAERGRYDYYHLLSGEDLPLKSQDAIHAFFQANAGKEFVQFESDAFLLENRVRCYHLFPKSYLCRLTPLTLIPKAARHAFLFLQERMGCPRNRSVSFQKGSNWFSITDDLARYTLSREDWIRQTFHHTLCGDEVFLQTVVLNSPFSERLYHPAFDNSMDANMRCILWPEGAASPKVFTMDDEALLLNTHLLFGRKFRAETDPRILESVVRHIAAQSI